MAEYRLADARHNNAVFMAFRTARERTDKAACSLQCKMQSDNNDDDDDNDNDDAAVMYQ